MVFHSLERVKNPRNLKYFIEHFLCEQTMPTLLRPTEIYSYRNIFTFMAGKKRRRKNIWGIGQGQAPFLAIAKEEEGMPPTI